MNAAAKQEASVAEALGSLAYESVFIYGTGNENWTRIQIRDNYLGLDDVAMFFGNDFTIAKDDRDARSLLIRNNKIAKVVA
ncbi:hypothetical protein UFOVP609_30 [uncultured Caudovirales phage]|uniref:Uncharacterized protein n=1 Tax=uncultured Caudovirales phage TaxID=2100421 RepID=A0A6J5N668_9CAUD|nr:hypothetical protein UFOVP609_30 [uncultured Caudovirales phage]